MFRGSSWSLCPCRLVHLSTCGDLWNRHTSWIAPSRVMNSDSSKYVHLRMSSRMVTHFAHQEQSRNCSGATVAKRAGTHSGQPIVHALSLGHDCTAYMRYLLQSITYSDDSRNKDNCSMTILSGSWICMACGTDLCLLCHADLKVILLVLRSRWYSWFI